VNIEQDLIQFIKDELTRSGAQLEPDTNLVGIVDSTGVIELVVFIADRYGLDVEIDAITPENFGSVRRLAQYIKQNTDKA
jgi:acyl carrier protein